MLVRQPTSILLAGDIRLPIQNADIINLRTISEEYGIETISTVAEEQLKSIIVGGFLDSSKPLQHFFSKHWHTRSAYLVDNNSNTIRSFSGGRDWVVDPESKNVKAFPCDSTRTIVEISKNVDPEAFFTYPSFFPDGKIELVKPESPLGAYFPDELREKIALTKQAARIAKENDIDVFIPEWIAALTFADKRGVEMAAGVYEMPNALPIHYLSREDEEIQRVVRDKIAKAAKGYIDADFMHVQLNLGNIWYFQAESGEWQVIFADWGGAYSIKDFDRDNKNWVEKVGEDPVNQLLTPRQLAIRYMLLPLLSGNGQFIKKIYEFNQNKDLGIWEIYSLAVKDVYSPYIKHISNVSPVKLISEVLDDSSVRLYRFLTEMVDDELLSAIRRDQINSPQDFYYKIGGILFDSLPSVICRLILKGIITEY